MHSRTRQAGAILQALQDNQLLSAKRKGEHFYQKALNAFTVRVRVSRSDTFHRVLSIGHTKW